MDTLHDLLSQSTVLRLFVTVGLGYLLGQIRVRGIGLGVAGVLFSGILVGAWGGPEFELPEIVTLVGLAIFVYSLGLQAGPGFFKALRSDGLRLTWLVLVAVLPGALVALASASFLGISTGTAAGLFCGGTTNTPALAATLDTLRSSLAPGDPEAVTPTIGYSIAYPFGVLGLILAMYLGSRWLKIPLERERQEYERVHAAGEITTRMIRVRNTHPDGSPLDAAWVTERAGAVVTRCLRQGHTRLVYSDSKLERGDVVLLVGTAAAIDRATALVGEAVTESVNMGRPDVATRRVLVSNPDIAGTRIGDLHLETLEAVITRVRRGDIEVAGTPNTVLELGDRVRLVAYERSLPQAVRLLGDSIKTITETDFLPLALGLSVGVLLGMVSIPLPFGGELRLGVAGGPLLVALILGWLGKTGRMIWGLPMEVNFTLRQFGLILFLVGVGIRAGGSILDPLRNEGFALLGAGALITLSVAFTTLLLGRLALKLNGVDLLGVVAGVHTQPAALAVANRMTESDGTNLAYAAVHPVATIIKIAFAQIIVSLLG